MQNLPLLADCTAAFALIGLYTKVVMVAAVYVESVTQLNIIDDAISTGAV